WQVTHTKDEQLKPCFDQCIFPAASTFDWRIWRHIIIFSAIVASSCPQRLVVSQIFQLPSNPTSFSLSNRLLKDTARWTVTISLANGYGNNLSVSLYTPSSTSFATFALFSVCPLNDLNKRSPVSGLISNLANGQIGSPGMLAKILRLIVRKIPITSVDVV
ncbi:nodulin MtN21 /EamA-like transporter family protein, partial [Striga asiatica]